MNIEVQIDQAEYQRLVRKFNAIKNEALGKPRLRRLFVKAAQPMVRAIKARVPVHTGALKKSIGVIPNMGVKSGSVFVGIKRERTTKKVTTWYGKILEFGSRYFKPKTKHKFFEPAVRESAQAVANSIIQQLKDNIQKYG